MIYYQNKMKWRGIRAEKRTIPLRVRNYIGDFLRFLKIRPAIKSKYIDVDPIV